MNNFTVEENKPYSGLFDCNVDKESLGKRLREAREEADFSRDEVVALDDVSISRTTLQQWEVGAREASIETLFILAKIYQADPFYIISGHSQQNKIESTDAVKGEVYDYVPFYRAEASAGYGAYPTDEESPPSHHLAFRRNWIRKKGLYLKDLVGLVVSGDSMEPTIHDDAAIIVNKAKNQAMDGNIYVIRTGNRLWVKRTQWLLNGGLRLISDNKTYSNIDISAQDLENEDVEIIGQVVHTAYDLVK